MKQTSIGFYVVQRMTCTINIPDGVSPQEARDAIVGRWAGDRVALIGENDD